MSLTGSYAPQTSSSSSTTPVLFAEQPARPQANGDTNCKFGNNCRSATYAFLPRSGAYHHAAQGRAQAGSFHTRKRSGGSSYNNHARAKARHDFDADKFARASEGPRCSLLRTWTRYHDIWHERVEEEEGEDSVPAFSLSVGKIHVVAAMMKAGGYRSFPNYLSRAKEYHEKMGEPWDAQLDRAGREVIRSCLRAIGPARQSATLDIPAVASNPRREDSQRYVTEGQLARQT